MELIRRRPAVVLHALFHCSFFKRDDEQATAVVFFVP